MSWWSKNDTFLTDQERHTLLSLNRPIKSKLKKDLRETGVKCIPIKVTRTNKNCKDIKDLKEAIGNLDAAIETFHAYSQLYRQVHKTTQSNACSYNSDSQSECVFVKFKRAVERAEYLCSELSKPRLTAALLPEANEYTGLLQDVLNNVNFASKTTESFKSLTEIQAKYSKSIKLARLTIFRQCLQLIQQMSAHFKQTSLLKWAEVNRNVLITALKPLMQVLLAKPSQNVNGDDYCLEVVQEYLAHRMHSISTLIQNDMDHPDKLLVIWEMESDALDCLINEETAYLGAKYLRWLANELSLGQSYK